MSKQLSPTQERSPLEKAEPAVAPTLIAAKKRLGPSPALSDIRDFLKQNPQVGKEAITHVSIVERLTGYTLIECRLETGRTHQIRIHLSEAGHPICGDRVYVKRFNATAFDDRSGAPRLALHATELGFAHPASGAALRWEMPLPPDLVKFVEALRGAVS